jgi:hypothetical protein
MYGCPAWYEDHVFHVTIGYIDGGRDEMLELIEHLVLRKEKVEMKSSEDSYNGEFDDKEVVLQKRKRKRDVENDENEEEQNKAKKKISERIENINKFKMGHFAGTNDNVFIFDRLPSFHSTSSEVSCDKKSEDTNLMEVNSFFVVHGNAKKITVDLKRNEK